MLLGQTGTQTSNRANIMKASKSGLTVKGQIDVWWQDRDHIKIVIRRESGPSQPGSPTVISRNSHKGLFEKLEVLLKEGAAPAPKIS